MQHLLTLDGLTPAELEAIYSQALALKRARASGKSVPPVLSGKTVALLFEKPSLRTRVSFEVAVRELGGDSLYLSPQEVGLGTREAVRDVAQVLSSYVHAVVIRTFSHALLEEFARWSSVPVINGLTDGHHPCQGLTDLFTISEHFGSVEGRVLAYVGDGNNVAHSLLQAAVTAGMNVRIATPAGYEPQAEVLAAAKAEARQTRASVKLLTDPIEAATGADCALHRRLDEHGAGGRGGAAPRHLRAVSAQRRAAGPRRARRRGDAPAARPSWRGDHR